MSTENINDFHTAHFSNNSPITASGWDTAYVVSTDIINASLLAHFGPGGDAHSRLSFRQSMKGAASMEGEFGPWQLTTGGSGSRLNLSLPIVSGTISLQIPGLPSTVDLAGLSLTVQVVLGFHAVQQSKDSDGTTRAQLKVRTNEDVPSEGKATDIQSAATNSGKTAEATAQPKDMIPFAHVVGLEKTNVDPECHILLGTFIETLAKEWLNDNLDFFDYVFLSVDVATTAAVGQWDWITPTYVGYAVTDGVFAILANTEGREPPTSGTISSAAIPIDPGVNAAFIIRSSLLLEKIIRRNMPSLFSGATRDDFLVSAEDLIVSNTRDLSLELEMDPKWYSFHPTVKATIKPGNLSVAFNQTTMTQTFSNISFPYGHDDQLTVNLTLSSSSKLGVDAAGRFAMQYGKKTVSTLSAQPDSSKIAWEALKGIGVNLALTAILCLSFGASGGRQVTRGLQVAEEATVAETTATRSAVIEAESLGASLETSIMRADSAGTQVAHAGEQSAIGSGVLSTELATVARQEALNTASWSLKGIMPRFTFKLWAMFAGQFGGELYSSLGSVDIIKIYDQDPEQMPTLRNFLDNCIRPATWTNAGDQQLVCAGLNGDFVMGFSVETREAVHG